MELPKNITQVGETERGYKIYIEDYVISYIKQMNRFARDKEISLSLYGKCASEETTTYYFIYGACKLDFLQKEVRHLSGAQNQEMEKLRIKYFPEYDSVGYAILDGEMVEGLYIKEQNQCRFITGYSCFYERNDSMLAYMLDNQSAQYSVEDMSLEKYDMVRRRQEERKIEYEEQAVAQPTHHRYRVATAALFLLLCFLGYATLQGEGTEGIKSGLKKTWNYLADQKIIVEETEKEVTDGGRLVAEDSLTDAILEENEKYALAASEEADPVQETQPEVEYVMQGIIEDIEVPDEVTPVVNMDVSENAEKVTDVTDFTNVEVVENVEPVTTEPEEVETLEPQNNLTYTIQKGDTLNSISKKQYGTIKYVKQICELNGIKDADNIRVGQKILLP